jgi:RND superfamily putative drug exporter
VLLVLVFRSLLVPLVGVLGFLLTTGASLGATVAVFQWGWLGALVNLDGTGPLLSLTPDPRHRHPVRPRDGLPGVPGLADARGPQLRRRALAAVRTGFRQAAPVVVAAAAIMFSVFAGFVPAGEATIKSIAFALAWASSSTPSSCAWCSCRRRSACSASGRGGCRALRWLPVLDVEGEGLRTAGTSGARVGAPVEVASR